jgi:glycosyltransferase involved in cell wall biosynthesis
MAAPKLGVPVLAIISDAVAPWRSGGKEVRTHNYSQQLVTAGYEVHIYTMKWWRGPRTISQGQVRLHAVCRPWSMYSGQRRSIWQAVAFSLACFTLLGARFDVVEVDQIPILPLLIVKIVCVLRRRPLVCTWHEFWGLEYWRKYLGLLGGLAALAERLALQLPDTIIAASEGTARRVQGVVSRRQRVFVGPNGIDLGHIQATPPAAEAYDLLFVGRLLPHKGVDLLLEAVSKLAARGTQLTLAVVGDGPCAADLKWRANVLRLQSNVTFLGELSTHAQVLSQMKSCKILAFPTRREGYGLAAIEAMACGLPVITSHHPDNFARLLVTSGRTGYLCEPDGSDLAELILRALTERNRLSAAACGEAERHTWQAAVAMCLPAYQSPRRNGRHRPFKK